MPIGAVAPLSRELCVKTHATGLLRFAFPTAEAMGHPSRKTVR